VSSKTGLGQSRIPGLSFTVMDLYDGTVAFVLHSLYGEKHAPEVFLTTSDRLSGRLSTERLAGLLATSLFDYYVPLLGNLAPDQILEVREEVSDTREGFTDFLLGFTGELEERIKKGSRDDQEEAAELMKRKLRPLFTEFRRQPQSQENWILGEGSG